MPKPKPPTRTAKHSTLHPPLHFTPLGDTAPFTPSVQRPVRIRARTLPADSHFEPHHHAWAQLAYCATGIVQVTAEQRATGGDQVTYIVPPSRAVWIPPGTVHAVSAIEQADLRTLYSLPGQLSGAVWRACRVLEVSPLLRELVVQLDVAADGAVDQGRERLLTALIVDELTRARTLQLGVELPRDARLKKLCEAMLKQPGRHASLDAWATEAALSPRTVSRLFRDELGTSFAQWRSQVLLAHALSMAARHKPMSHIATELGYASASAFTAMVTRTVGMPPSRFFAEA